MKYLVIKINSRDGSTVIHESDNVNEAIRLCNRYNRMNDGNRYTIYSELEV